MNSVFEEKRSCRKASPQAGMHVAVCIPTFRRPEGLKCLLAGLEKLTFVKAPEPQVSIVVADNNPPCSAAGRPIGTDKDTRWPVHIEMESRRGVSYARNTAVKAAIESGAEWIAFIDDDEIPEPLWLDELLCAQKAYSADLVAGPVLPDFEDGTPAWVIKGGFFDRPRLKTGTVLSSTRTGNLLVSAHCFNGEPAFDPNFAKSGGADTLFTIQRAREGRKIVWADEAVVRETVPLRRTTLRYILSRAYAGGNSWARIEYMLRPRSVTKVSRIVKGFSHTLQGAISLLPSALIGPHAAVRSASRIWLGAGQIAGVFGRRAEKYGVRS